MQFYFSNFYFILFLSKDNSVWPFHVQYQFYHLWVEKHMICGILGRFFSSEFYIWSSNFGQYQADTDVKSDPEFYGSLFISFLSQTLRHWCQ